MKKEALLLKGKYSGEINYWIRTLPDEIEQDFFPAQRVSNGTVRYEQFHFAVDGFLYNRLQQISGGVENSLFGLLLANLAALIFRYSGKESFCLVAPICRQEDDVAYLNTVLPLVLNMDGQHSFKELVYYIRNVYNEAVTHQNCPLENVLNLKYGSENKAFFSTAVLLRQIQERKYLKDLQPDLLFLFSNEGDRLVCEMEYNSAIYDRSMIEAIAANYLGLLTACLDNSNAPISSIDYISREEKEKIVLAFNETTVEYPWSKTITEIIEAQMLRDPDHTAISYNQERISYAELCSRSNRLAHYLREQQQLKPDDLVAVFLERTPDLLISILAILKAGAAYLPVDVELHDNRIGSILKNSRAACIVTSQSYTARVVQCAPSMTADRIILPEELLLDDYPDTFPENINQPGDLAYVIYTSGTSGEPKGVMVSHQSLVHYNWWAAKKYVKDTPVSFPLFTSISFDLTITSIYVPLITGNTVVIYQEDGGNMVFEKVIAENKVDVIKLTPTHLRMMCEMDTAPISRYSKVKCFIVGGEEFPAGLAKKVAGIFNGNVEIYNEYGPTEAAVGCMIYQYKYDETPTVPIGVPSDNMRIYLLDKFLNPVPAGVAGEMYLAGDGLARGYLYDPGLTAQKFIDNVVEGRGRMYKTGDYARMLPGGQIEYIGRIDSQVKIRGYRIELREIEIVLNQYEALKEAVVLVQEKEGEKHLVAYYVSDVRLNINDLREYLLTRFPAYMVPSFFLKIDSIPLTMNGKLDKKVLSAMEICLDDQYSAPRNEVERKLAEIWADVLKLDISQIGIHKSFFEIGGHSLNANRLCNLIDTELNYKISLRSLFETPTIREMASLISIHAYQQQGEEAPEDMEEMRF